MQGEVVREHIRAPQMPGTGGYRYLFRSEELASVLAEHRPQIVVCGSPIVMPVLVRRALDKARVDAAIVGFWHADFPRTYFARAAARIARPLSGLAESAGWTRARRAYADFDATLVASQRQFASHGRDRRS
jgi:alpha-1,6-mannosyltransferase